MINITQNIIQVTQQIQQYALDNQRDTNSIALIAVSKFHPVEAIEQAIAAGLTQFGENYAQEGVEKISYFKQFPTTAPLVWHFIGPIQSNKTNIIAQNFHWVQSLDRLKIAQRLNDQRPANLPPLQVLLQINISGETTKSGITLEEILPFAESLMQYPRLQLRGLMTIPSHQKDASEHLHLLMKMHQAYLQLQQHYDSVDTLSMGMSEDLQVAIQAGTTMVRVGTAIFGSR